MKFTPDREFCDVSTELIGAMRAAGYSPRHVVEVLIAAIIIVNRESTFTGDIEQTAEIIQRSIITMNADIHTVTVSPH
jgi:hypothetical protein